MSQENVEIVRRAYDAFNRGDIDAAFKAVAPDFEFDMSRAVGFNIDRDVYDLIQFRRLFDEYVGSWEAFRLGPDEFIDAGEHVVVPFTNRASGRGGIEVQARGTINWRIRDGALVSACLYQERDEALKGAGLPG
jgi:ketosteroid isomerase-like protein